MKRVGPRFGRLLRAHRGDAKGRITGLPLDADVEVLTDAHGVPHIFAENEDDLFTAQGFLHAQDRLWQMETLRRLPLGRLSEVAGPSMVDLDHFFLLAGFERLRRRALESMTDHDRRILESYVNGINAYIRWTGKRLPIEFRTLKIVPAEWRVEDLCGVLPFTSWSLQMNYEQELLAVLARDRLTAELFNELYPVEPDARLPREGFFERFRDVRIAPILPAAFAFFPQLAQRAASAQELTMVGHAGAGMSNCWVVADGEHGAPILANDPHLAMMVPQIWHVCHLSCPTLNAAGVSMLGVPGIVLGRNEKVSWGATNVTIDMVDLYIVRVDPDEPTHYFIGDERHEMTRDPILIPVAGGETREVVVYRTLHGTVLSHVEAGHDAVVVLKWYGTLPDDAFEETTIGCFLSLMYAKTVDEAMEIGGMMKSAGQNLTLADAEGNIAWKATGLVPIRSGYSGRTPADGSDPRVDWKGFVPYSEMPSSKNPSSGRIATANNRTVDRDFPHKITHSWLATYRHDRIVELLEQTGGRRVEDHRAIQMDVHSKQAERLVPRLLELEPSIAASEAKALLDLFRSWDRRMDSSSAPAAIFAVFVVEFEKILAEPLLGEHLPLYLFGCGFFYSPVDALLTGEALPGLLEAAGFAPNDTAAVVERALLNAHSFLSEALGPKHEAWRWGDLHTHLFAHSGADGRLSSWLLNRGPFPARGDTVTLNVSAFDPGRLGDGRTKYRTVTGPSMRLVASMDDPDNTVIIAPMGQSGKPGNRHYDDMILKWLDGEQIPLPLTRAGSERIARYRAVLGR